MPKKLNDHFSGRDKLLQLYLRLILDGRKHFQRDIASDFECSPQTVNRLILNLEKNLGDRIEIENGLENRRRYYRLRSKTEEKAFGFSFEELRYLAMCRDLAAPFLSEEAARRVSRSLTALALQLGESAVHTVSGTPIGFRSKGYIDYEPHTGTIATLNQAIEKRQICTVTYKANGREEPSDYRYAPGRLLAMNGTLYVQGYRLAEKSLLQERPTTFLLHRISKVTPTGEYFRFDAAGTDIKAFGLNWHEPKRVTVHVAPDAADYVRDRIWSDDQSIEEEDDGSILLTVTTTSEKELQAWVWGFGGLAKLENLIERAGSSPKMGGRG